MDLLLTTFVAVLIAAPEPLREQLRSETHSRGSDTNHAFDVPDTRTLTQLIDGLSSVDYEVRESSEKQLLRLGLAAIPPLAESSDGRGELAIRVASLIDSIRRDHLKRLCESAIDGQIDAARQLPMWSRFHIEGITNLQRAKILGVTLSAIPNLRLADRLDFLLQQHDRRRQAEVYTELFRRLVAVDLPYSQIDDRRNAARAALLIGGHPATILTQSDGVALGPLLSRGDVGRMMDDSQERHVAEWLIRNYAQNLPDDGKVHAFPIVLRFQVRDVSEIARVVLEHGISPRPLAQAAAAVSASGTRADVALLKPLFGRPDFFGGGGSPVRLNDVALYAAILLTNQNPQDYGFRVVPRQAPAGFDIYSLRYVRNSLQRRAAAFDKWEAWERLHFQPLIESPEDAIHGERL